MNIKTLNNGSYLLLELEGDLDASSCILLDSELEKAMEEEKNILINCASLDYISSAGLGVFMSHLKDFEAKNIQLVLYGLSDKVYKVFEILGLHNLLKIVENKQAAEAIL